MAPTDLFLFGATLLAASIGAGAKDAPCVFPFTYQNKHYTACTSVGANEGKLWCSETQNYDKDEKWHYCSTSAYGGSSEGQPCVFPFRYKGRIHLTCPRDSKGAFWCATTSDYDLDELWSYCPDTLIGGSAPGAPCVFPFTYGDQKYYTCTTAGEEGGRLWCSTTDNYPRDRKWTYCHLSGTGANDPTSPCLFPFWYREVAYHSCTRVRDGKLWCATTRDYDRDRRWKYCSQLAHGGNSGGKACVFPFHYDGKQYQACTAQNSPAGYWCGTTSNYTRDKQWSYCPDTAPRI
ncbi:epididymal sperm-binding protein 1-like [Ornithorhynchus anatinus]|uniref:epididymal sperm-binding protein 1-like n=1 Tax=Ornithorhynchus anatinus TaxID=9258 RepID=UPI0010A86757|nr:epididymal sperm-binding protein 1-like [Ornithorhynchus anatinus]